MPAAPARLGLHDVRREEQLRYQRGIALVTAAGLAALAIGGTAVAQTATGRIDRQAVQRAADTITGQGALGVQVRVVDGRDRFTARAGVAEWGGTAPVPVDGRFRAGSITKTFVSTVVLQLAGEGRVGLDDPVGDHLPGLLPDGDRITVRHLLQHTSGLYNYTAALPLDPAGFETIRYKQWQPRELVALAAARPLEFPPGTAWAYSNTNYVVAGLLVEKLTGRPYGDAVRDRIFRPLGLRGSTIPAGRTEINGPHAHGYYRVAGEVVDVTRLNPSVADAAGELVTTTADLDRFLTALLSGRLLRPAQQAELLKAPPFTKGYGLGIETTELPCGVKVHGHGGGIPGYSSFMGATGDGKTRLTASFTHSPDAGDGGDGLERLLTAAFC